MLFSYTYTCKQQDSSCLWGGAASAAHMRANLLLVGLHTKIQALAYRSYSSCSLSSLALSYHCQGTKLSCWPFLLSRACLRISCLLLNTWTKSLALVLDSLLRFLLCTKSKALQLRSHEEDDGMAASTLIAMCRRSGAPLRADMQFYMIMPKEVSRQRQQQRCVVRQLRGIAKS